MTDQDRELLQVACIGDSLTEGYSRRGTQFHPYLQWLPALVSRPAQFHCFGRSAEKTDQILKRVARDAFGPTQKPKNGWDIAIILGGTNDLAYDIPHEKIAGNLKSIALLARSSGAHAFVLSIPPLGQSIYRDDYLLEQQKLNACIKAMCQREAITFVDLFEEMLGEERKWAKSEWMDGDGLHFSIKGYEHMAEVVAEAINSYLDAQKSE